MRMSQSFLKCRPNCEYSLTGLPNLAQCPECGFLYVRRCQVFRQGGGRAILVFALGCGLIISGAVLGLWGRGLGLGRWWLLVGGITIVLAQWAFVRGKRNKAVLSINGLTLMDHGSEPIHFSWESIGSAKWGAIMEQVRLLSPYGDEFWWIDASFLGSNRRSKKLVAAINEWKARHAAAVSECTETGPQ